MFCLFISLATLCIGICYVILGYNVAVGWMQILLGVLSVVLCVAWLAARRQEKPGPPEQVSKP